MDPFVALTALRNLELRGMHVSAPLSDAISFKEQFEAAKKSNEELGSDSETPAPASTSTEEPAASTAEPAGDADAPSETPEPPLATTSTEEAAAPSADGA